MIISAADIVVKRQFAHNENYKVFDFKRRIMSQSPTQEGTASKRSAADNRVTVRNPASPGATSTVDATKYHAMKDALLQVLPPSAPGLTGAEMFAAVLPHLPAASFPGGAKAGWWLKCVQLDLEAQGIVVREASKPLRWHRQ